MPCSCRRAAALVVVLLLAAPSAAAGADCPPPIQARIDFLESRLDARRGYARNWWRLWTAGYAAGAVFQGVNAGLEGDEGKRADLIVSAVKAAYGTGRLWWWDRPNARHGGDPMREVPTGDANACERRLAIGEELLRVNAKESRKRWSWKRHLSNIAINAIGGVIVAEGFDENDGWISAGIGIGVGELQILSRPAGSNDLAEYERRFSPPSAAKPTWSISTRISDGAGVQLQMRF